MPTLSQPELLPGPFAYNGDKNDIPDASASLGAASYQQGFPPITQLPVNAGGIPPQRNDFNGILNALSQHTFWQQSGGMYAWSATLDYAVPSMVVGSDKELYFALQPSGPGTAAGAKNPTSAAGKAYWQNIAYVLPVATATKLGGVMVNKGGLQVSASGLLSLLLMQGGGLNLNAAGQLYVDTADFSEEMLRAFLEGIIADGGGLGFDSSGKLYVDADAFSEDLLERFLKSIRVPIWLTANKAFYVNIKTGSDTLSDGRGETADKPFKTVDACIRYITDNYNLSIYDVNIRVAAGVYPAITLRPFQGSGAINILQSGDGEVIITNGATTQTVSGSGTRFYIKNCTLRCSVDITTVQPSGYVRIVNATGGSLTLDHCDLELIETGGAYASNISNVIAVSASTYGAVDIRGGSLTISTPLIKAAGRGVTAYYATQNGILTLAASRVSAEDSMITVSCTGVSTFIRAQGATAGRSIPLASNWATFTGTADGQRFAVSELGKIQSGGAGPDFFPGDKPGVVDSATYGIYV